MPMPAPEAFVHLVAARAMPLAARGVPADRLLEAGKRHNLERACHAFDGAVLEAGEELSFWSRLGRAGLEEGYVLGADARGGSLFPTVGGGLCLLSTALFELAAQLGWKVLERHGHPCDSLAPEPGAIWGLDARVLFPHVNLRLAPAEGPVRITARVGGAGLLLAVYALESSRRACVIESVGEHSRCADGGWIRENRLRRRTFDKVTGALLADEIIAENFRQGLGREPRRAA